MTHLISAELLKLRSTRLFFGLLAAATGLTVFVTAVQLATGGEGTSLTIEGAASVVQSQEDLRSIVVAGGVGALFTLVLGATAVSGEYRHGTIASTFLITPSRSRVVVAKVVSYAVAGTAFGVVVSGAGLLVAVVWLAATGVDVPFGASVASAAALNAVGAGLAAGLGVGVGAAIPSQLAAVLVALGWVTVAEQLLSGLLPVTAEWLPFAGANAALIGQHPHLTATGGFLLFSGYLVAVAAVGIQVTRVRDVV